MQVNKLATFFGRKILAYCFNLFEGTGIGKIPGVFWIFSRISSLLFSEIIIDSDQKLYTGGIVGPRTLLALYHNGSHEPHVSSLFCSLLKNGMTVIDVGAFIGYYTLLAAKRVGNSGRVLAFEPSPTAFSLLLKNIKINNWNNIKAFNYAVSDKNGKKIFDLSRLSFAHTKSSNTVVVNTVSIDSFLHSLSIDDVDLVKIDVEGAELEVLRGMKRILSRGKVKIICEVHPDRLSSLGYSTEDVENILEEYGYEIYLISPDGLIPTDSIGDTYAHYLFTAEKITDTRKDA